MATSDAKSNYLEQKIIEAVLKNTTFAGGTNIYVALLTAAATPESSSVTEVSGGSYARQAIVAASGWSAGSQVSDRYEVSNAALITFPTATVAWGTITHFALYDASTSGNMLYFGALDASKIIDIGDVFTFPIGSLKVAES